MENKTVETKKETAKKEVVKFDFKGFANSVVTAFQSDTRVDVIADTDMPKGPRNTTLAEYRYIHFFKSGTEKNMFGCYIVSNGKVRFALNLAVEQYLDAGLTKKDVQKTVKGEKKKVAVDVYCDIQDAISVAQLIVTAYQSIPAKETKKKDAKKSEPKQTPAKSEKKPAAKKTTTKKPAKKAATA